MRRTAARTSSVGPALSLAWARRKLVPVDAVKGRRAGQATHVTGAAGMTVNWIAWLRPRAVAGVREAAAAGQAGRGWLVASADPLARAEIVPVIEFLGSRGRPRDDRARRDCWTGGRMDGSMRHPVQISSLRPSAGPLPSRPASPRGIARRTRRRGQTMNDCCTDGTRIVNALGWHRPRAGDWHWPLTVRCRHRGRRAPARRP
jgi:hypothetical protein